MGPENMGKPKPQMIVIIRDRVRMRESTSPTPSRLHSLYPTSFLQKDEEEKVTTLLGALKAKRPPKEQARDAINHYIPGARGAFFRRLNCLLNTVMSANTFRLEMCLLLMVLLQLHRMHHKSEGLGQCDSVKQAI